MSNYPLLRLLVLNRNQSLDIQPASRITIGRDLASDLVLQDDEVSRNHAVFVREQNGGGPKYKIKDLNSLNGVLLNGKRVREAEIAPGDEIILGGTILLLSPDTEINLQQIASPKGKVILQRIGEIKPFRPVTVEAMSIRALAQRALEMLKAGAEDEIWSEVDAGILFLKLLELSLEKNESTFYQTLLEIARELTGADRGVVMMIDPKDESLNIRSLLTDQQDQTIVISPSITRMILKGRKSIFSSDVAQDERFADLQEKHSSQEPHTLLAMPLQKRKTILGFLYLDSFKEEIAFTENHLMLLSIVLHPAMRFAPTPSAAPAH